VFKDAVGKIEDFFKSKIAILFFICAVVWVRFLFLLLLRVHLLRGRPSKVEHIIRDRQKILEGYANAALNKAVLRLA